MFERLGEVRKGSVDRIGDSKASMMESSSSSSGSSRRATVTQVVSCLVDGCNSDLSQCREYHRRHKVCELHSKTPKVSVGGREQRFCQQCSRFHSLAEFDDGKRSCRKRLDGHNRRRRKPRSESLPRNSGGLLTNQQGAVLLSFASPQTFPSAAAGSASAWAEAVRSRDDAAVYANYIDTHNFHGSLVPNYTRENQFQILQATYSTSRPEASVSQPPYPNSASQGSGSSQKLLSNVLSEAIHSDCALSLLSSVPAETSEFGLRQLSMVQPHAIFSGQSIGHRHCPYSQGGAERMHAASSLDDSNGGSNADLHCQGTFPDKPDASSAQQQTLSFMWH